jgi:carboxymethylenebutenolidase
MCFEFDALPPDLPDGRAVIAGGAAAESLTVTAADGNRFAAALAESPRPSGPGVVILPDVRGLYRFYIALAERLAEAGHHMPHVEATTIEGIQTDLAAARAALAERTGVTQFASLGFCFGGGHSFWAGTNPDLGLDAVIGFYGLLNPARRGITNRPNLVERGDEVKVPVLGLFGGDDESIPAADIEAFDAGLERAGVDHEIVTYPGAPHSFFDKKQEEFAEASADAWTRVLDFLAAEPVEA